MDIKCPHCKVSFDSTKCVLRERKTKYQWYEFTGKATHCPNCDKRFQVDLSMRGLSFVLLLLLVVAPFVYFEYELVSGAILVSAVYIGKKYYWKIMKITAINAT